MRFTVTDDVVLVIGIAILALWLILYMKGRGNAEMFNTLDDKDFPMKDLYFVGYAATQMMHMTFHDEKDQEMRRKLAVLYGDKYVDFYTCAVYSQRITMALTIAALAMPIYFFAGGSIIMFIFILAAGGVAYYYYGKTLQDKIDQRSDSMLADFTEVVSKLALLVNTGMVLSDAWRMIASSGDTVIYQEMQLSVREMDNGMPETEALYVFGQRCMLPEIKKFATTLIQGISKGNAELSMMLRQQSKEFWQLKQEAVKRKGALANDKLIFPLMLVFIGILIMVLVPVFSGMGM